VKGSSCSVTGGHPASIQQSLHFCSVEWTELVDKSYPGVKLRETSETIFNARHANEDHPTGAFVNMDRRCSMLFICDLSASSITFWQCTHDYRTLPGKLVTSTR
jgi:hypothetical protein